MAMVAAPSAVGADFPAERDDALRPEAEKCRKQPDAFYVPADPRGHWFWWYCRADPALSGDGFGPLPFGYLDKLVNRDQPDNWEEWNKKYSTASGLVNFQALDREPCDTWDNAKQLNGSFDMTKERCAKIKQIAARASPCDQWWDVIKNAAGKPDVEPLDTARDGKLIAKCNSDQTVFRRAWAPPKIKDDREYSPYDFSAPEEVTGPLGEVLGIAQWVAMVAGIFGVLICAAKLAIAHRNGYEEPAHNVLLIMGSVSVAMSAMAIASMIVVG